MLCVSLIISPASYNGHHVAGCFAVDWMKLIKLKGRGEKKGATAWLEMTAEGGEGKGKGEEGGVWRVDTCLMLRVHRMRPRAYHRPYATVRKLAEHLSAPRIFILYRIKISNRRAVDRTWIVRYRIISIIIITRIISKIFAQNSIILYYSIYD